METELLVQADKLVGGSDAVLVIDDTAIPKKGTHSVGVAAQYASALGKTANCQTLVSLTLARGEVPVMLAVRLFLPESWTGNRARLERAGVPAEYRTARTKPEMALSEIDRAIGGRKRTIDVREILNGIFYVLSTGCQWQALPKDLPPKSTVWAYFDLWTCDGTLERIHHALYVAVREQAAREASPTTAIIDSQSAKGRKKLGLARPTRLRCGQEDHGSQAPHPRRYARLVAEPGGACRQHFRIATGWRWCSTLARASFIPVH